ncbi:MAG: hypothetical protein GIKADHBN_01794 [Phycisphaerales bacterium]|nr:hypothetical protein [Phycisphaerales bacterium]
MPGPKDFTQCTLEAVKDPLQAKDAITAEPGAKQKPAEGGKEKKGAGIGTVSSSAAAEASQAGEPQPALTWVGVHLVDDKGNPAPNHRYKVKLPDGSIQEGVTDEEGKARWDGVHDGSVEICFPDIHGDEWQPAS